MSRARGSDDWATMALQLRGDSYQGNQIVNLHLKCLLSHESSGFCDRYCDTNVHTHLKIYRRESSTVFRGMLDIHVLKILPSTKNRLS